MPAPRQKHLAETVALWLTGLLLVLPFSFTFLLLVSDDVVKFFPFHWMGLALGLAAIALLPWAGREHGVRIPHSVLPLLGLVGICLYQWTAPDIPYSAPYITYVTYMVWAIALFALGATLHQSLGAEKLLQTIAWFALIGALPAASIGLMQIFGVPQELRSWVISFDGGFPVGNIRHPNFFTCHVMLGLLALAYLSGIRRLALRWTLPCALLLVSALAFSSSRTLYLYFLTTIAWSALVWWQTRDITSKRILLALTFGFTLFLALQWVILPLLKDLIGELFNAAARLHFYQQQGQFYGRTDLWVAAWEMFRLHPLAGGGIGNYSWFHFLLTDHETPGPASNPHNLLLFQLATTGTVGTVSLLLFIFVIANRSRVLRHDSRYWFPTAFLLIILVYSMLEFPLWLPAFLGVTAFLCGALHPAGWTVNIDKLPAKLVFTGLMGICMLSLFSTFQDYHRLDQAQGRNVPAHVFDRHVRDAIKNPWLHPYAERVFLNKNLVLNDEKAVAVLLRMNTRQLHWFPTQRTLTRQSILLSAADRQTEAMELFAAASKRYPGLKAAVAGVCEKKPTPKLEELCHAARDSSRDHAE